MLKRKPKIWRQDYGLTLREVADRFERPVTRQAILAIEKAKVVKPLTALRYEEAVRLAVIWRKEIRNVRSRFRPAVNVAIAKAARRVGRLRS